MSTGVGCVGAEGTEDKAQETGIPCGVLKTTQGDRAVVRAKMSAKAEGAKGSREEEMGWERKRKKDRRECPKGLCKPEKPMNCGNAGTGLNRVCGQTRC